MVMSEKPKTDRQTLLIPLGNIHIHIFKWTETLILIFSQLWFEKWLIQLKTGQNILAVKVDMPVLIWVFFGGKEKNEIKKTNTICHNHTIYKNIKHTHSKTVQLVDQGTLFSNLQTVLFKPPSDDVDIVFSFSGSADVCENTIKADWKLNHCTSVLCLEPVTVIQGMTKVHPSVAKWNL